MDTHEPTRYIGAVTVAALLASLLVAPTVMGAAGLQIATVDPADEAAAENRATTALGSGEGICVGSYENESGNQSCDGVWVGYPNAFSVR